MTSRRSVQNVGQRQSRQTQFVPGHVGGRVASAQPVANRRTIGAAARAPGIAPTDLDYFQTQYSPTEPSQEDTPTCPAGSVIVALVAGRYTTSITPPAGWSILGTGTAGPNVQWIAGLGSSSADSTWSFQTDSGVNGGVYDYQTVISGYIYEGGVGGTWGLATGVEYAGSPGIGGEYTPCQPDPSWEVYAQMCLIGGLYGGGTAPPGESLPSGAMLLGTLDNPHVNGGSLAPTKWASTTYTYGYIGLYGNPGSLGLALGWTP